MNFANVYDFDKTIFDGDSTAKFYFHCLKRYPSILIFLPLQGLYFMLYLANIVTKTVFKEKMYLFLTRIPDVDSEINLFWKKNMFGIKKWYKKNKKKDDIIISGSPEFLLRPVCKKIGISNLIASRVDKKTGKYTGLNCINSEKVNRLREKFPNIKIKEFYSDSYIDEPLALLAEESYLVEGEKLYRWHEYKNGVKILKK
ncbi:MAG: haloacid dehalogenase-like hydrolase [Firmicutes bacterium]|nr:haloacid dehalogenase-like hydrolase [Bacillota bacterium]